MLKNVTAFTPIAQKSVKWWMDEVEKIVKVVKVTPFCDIKNLFIEYDVAI